MYSDAYILSRWEEKNENSITKKLGNTFLIHTYMYICIKDSVEYKQFIKDSIKRKIN